MVKILILSFIVSLGSFAHSQAWYIRLKPGYSFAFGTWQQQTTFESPEGKFEVFPRSNFGNIAYGYRAFCGSLDLYQYKKWTFGLSYFKSSAITGERTRYAAMPSTNPNSNYTTVVIRKTVYSTNIYQGGLFADYCFSNKKRIKQDLGLGFFLQFDRTHYQPLPFWVSTLADGTLIWKPIEDSTLSNKKSFCAQFRYELSFSNKKGKNLFSVFALYQQGFGIMSRTFFEYKHSLGYVLNQTATSKSSGFYLGISKPILIYDQAKKRKHEG